MMAPAGTRNLHGGPAVISRALEANSSKCESENDVSTDWACATLLLR